MHVKLLLLRGNNTCSLEGTTVVPCREQQRKIHMKIFVPFREQQLFPIGNNKGKIEKKN